MVKVKCQLHHFILPAGSLIGECKYCGKHKRFISFTELQTVITLKRYKGRGRINRYLASLGIEATLILHAPQK